MTKEELEAKENEETKTIETIVEAVTEKSVDKILEKIKNDKPLRKDIFGGEGNDTKEKELADQKAAGAEYFKKLIAGDRVATKALSAGTSTSGSELVPTYVSDQIITVAQNYGLVRKHATKWPVQGINTNVPTMSSLTAYRLASDTAAITASQPTTGNVQLRTKTVGVIIPVSKVLLQNSTADVIAAITALAGKAIAKLEDQWGLLGLASGEGVFQNASVPVATMASATTYNGATAENLLDVLDLIDENFLSESMRWAMSLSMLNNFRRLRANVSTDKQGFLFEGFGGTLPPTMWDIPYDTSAVMPKNSDGSQAAKACVALVDYSNMIHGDAMEYTVEISDQATITDTDGSTLINLFQQNMVALKVWGQIDIQLANAAKAFGILKTHA